MSEGETQVEETEEAEPAEGEAEPAEGEAKAEEAPEAGTGDDEDLAWSVATAEAAAANAIDPEAAAELREFVRDALVALGAEVLESEDEAVLELRLPAEGDLPKRLGHAQGAELQLVFSTVDLRPGHELVAPGCHLLHVLESDLEQAGRRVYLAAPGAERLSLKALGLRSSARERWTLSDREALEGYDIYLVARLRYRARERHDEVACVKVELRPGIDPEHGWDAATAFEDPAPALFELEPRARKRVPALALKTALHAGDESLQRYARDRSRELQDGMRETSRKDLSRLHAYYSGQIAEYMRRRKSDLNQLRIEELEEERELRVKELIAQAEVHAEIEPLQLLTVERPLQRARLLRTPAGEEEPTDARWLLFDRVDGSYELDEEDA
ncbi:MAG TPA: hypothetical protein DEA08_34705 [Planctomycetes bacterium]|nr:hypothetical protein [Planctomycetota bacterium]